MNLLQPVLGILASIIVILVSLGISAGMAPITLGGWVTLVVAAAVPAQIVFSLVLRGEHPALLAKLPQPWKGIGFTLLTVAIGVPIAFIVNATLGGGITPPTPFATLFLISTVPLSLCWVIVFQCWPFTVLFPDRPLLMGMSTLAAVYAAMLLIFRDLYNFSFLVKAPYYQPNLDPQGALMALLPLTFAFTCVAVILSLVLLDFWPLCRLPKPLSMQPWFGLITLAFVLAVATGIWWFFIGKLEMDLLRFQVQVALGMIYGVFVLLVLLEGAAFVKLPQPARGTVLIVASALIAMAIFPVHLYLCERLFGLKAGPPAFDAELWIAPAMFSVGFPLMVTYADYFQFWPFRRTPASLNRSSEATGSGSSE